MNDLQIQKLLDELKVVKKSILDNRPSEQSDFSQNNLNDYITLRSFNLTQLQDELTSIGLSSLGRAQTCVISSIDQNIKILEKILGNEVQSDESHALDFKQAKKMQRENTKIFGPISDEHSKTKIMVTLPSEASQSSDLIDELITQGASVLRINTAHDDLGKWSQMAAFIKEANKNYDKDTKIYVDLAGPKNRTGEIKTLFTPFTIGSKQNRVEVELIPQSDFSAITQPAFINEEGKEQHATLVVDNKFYQKCKKFDTIKMEDRAKGKKRTFAIHRESERIFFVADKKVTIDQESRLCLAKHSTKLHNFLYLPQEIRLFQNDEIILTHQDTLGEKAYTYKGKEYAAIIACSNKAIFEYIKIGDEVFIDDGKIGTLVSQTLPIGIVLKVILAKAKGTLLKAQKGINFPSTQLDIPALTNEDSKNLKEVMAFADLIGLSFTQEASDIQTIQDILNQANKHNITIVPKIETKLGVENLPKILSQLIQRENYALMIARGDLAIEVGFDNLPYIQQEIFDICEAALVPVIYATQILEGKMKKNLPSRAEVTDVAFAQRADCIMLNKGPYVVDTLVILKRILHSMHKVFQKNRQLLNVCTAWNIHNQNERIDR